MAQARGWAAHAARVAALTAFDAAGLVAYERCTPLPGARYVLGTPLGVRVLVAGEVVPYLRGLLDAHATAHGRQPGLEAVLNGRGDRAVREPDGRTGPVAGVGRGGAVADP